jgi:Flp pilus assembly protein TadD
VLAKPYRGYHQPTAIRPQDLAVGAEELPVLVGAVVAFPDHSLAWGLLGVALARQGQIDSAVAALREALRVELHSATAHRHLGRLLARSGHSAEALYHLRLDARLEGPGG